MAVRGDGEFGEPDCSSSNCCSRVRRIPRRAIGVAAECNSDVIARQRALHTQRDIVKATLSVSLSNAGTVSV